MSQDIGLGFQKVPENNENFVGNISLYLGCGL